MPNLQCFGILSVKQIGHQISLGVHSLRIGDVSLLYLQSRHQLGYSYVNCGVKYHVLYEFRVFVEDLDSVRIEAPF